MRGVPETRYASVGEYAVAYQVMGDGPDLLYVPSAQFPIDLAWDEPAIAGHLRRIASFSRLILTDLLGAGSSDSYRLPLTPLCNRGPTALSLCSMQRRAI